ncbi:phytoene desaturase family protein [Schumannella soli]|uniref:NAD(P)/FAD-dependent oxidoreductase n=1 Tax=Schumannella soli TaxID=2590779 RepID=A0A506Y114_9MICO|nr:NAD(P)/FAD-dependent oxidoreductase [Schumannella soli]TPW75583.1 NAD(P)/FAD-dependent oxidoreductase [Schumannella soli]
MSEPDAPVSADVVIVGGGHNGLTAAAYLARAGRSVVVLERLGRTGGAAVSEQAFAGVDARLSRYSYLVSLLPRTIIDDLGLDIRLARRRYSSYTPVPGDAEGLGLLVDRNDADATRASFADIGAAEDAEAYAKLGDDLGALAEALWPTVTEPLRRRSAVRTALARDDLWDEVFERPIGEAIERRFASDLVRGVVATDALIGTFAGLHDASLDQNRCLLYHVIGGGTGDWDVPIGGMGAVTDELARVAREAGARIITGAEVLSVTPDGEVRYRVGEHGVEQTISAEKILSGAAPEVLDRLLAAGGATPATGAAHPEGAQVKVNLLLSRLPRLKDAAVAPEAAFGGTFHINETATQLEAARAAAAEGRIPNPLPAEIYCHTLADPSILSLELAASGAYTLTVFGLHVPDRLASAAAGGSEAAHDELRDALQAAVLASLNSVLAEPIEPLLLTDADGRPCVETKTTRDIERALAMPGGNIFHGPLSWPFASDDEPLDTPAQRWGVATAHERILLCGSGARRGGAVSGLGGHNAAMAVLEELTIARATLSS